MSKKYDFYENLEVYEDKNYVSNEVKADNCYNLKSISALKYGNTFEQTNPSSTKITGTGCGFEDKFSQTITSSSSKAVREANKEKAKTELNKMKAKYLVK